MKIKKVGFDDVYKVIKIADNVIHNEKNGSNTLVVQFICCNTRTGEFSVISAKDARIYKKPPKPKKKEKPKMSVEDTYGTPVWTDTK